MATAPAPDVQQCAYHDCDGGGRRDAQYCSPECRTRHAARQILRTLRWDHRVCASCHRKVRDVFPPGRSPTSSDRHKPIPECAIGRAYPTPDTQAAITETFGAVVDERGAVTIAPRDGLASAGVACDCGATHHATLTRPLPLDRMMAVAKRLSDRVTMLLHEGEHEFQHDRDVLLDRVRAEKEDPDIRFDDQGIFERALGDAILAATPS
jgi:hypothetical protein